MEVRLTTDKEDYWEAKYMIDEACGRGENGTANLTSQDRAIISFVDLDLSSDYYWGRKFFNDKCYFQSLRYFLKIHRGLKSVWKDLSSERREAYYDVCCYIGFLFMCLSMPNKAYYCLDAARLSNDIGPVQEYINCLCHLNDPQVISIIQGYLKQAREFLDEEKDEPAESWVDFHQFFLRRLAYMFVNQKAYDEAEDLLKRMIKNGDSVEFAKAELEYIQRMRAKE